jgi:hypothetical protein
VCKSAKSSKQRPPSLRAQDFSRAHAPVFTGERALQVLDAFDDWSSKSRAKKLRRPRSRANDQGMTSTEDVMR